MIYDELYPTAKLQEQPLNEDVLKGSEFRPCWHCSRMTQWVSISFEAPICSPECEASKWDEYFLALSCDGDAKEKFS